MQALRKRRERWEYNNQQRLELVFEVSQQQIQKQIRLSVQLFSLLLYIVYKGSQVLMRVLRVLWVQPKDLDRRLQDAEQQRLKLSSLPGHWLK